MRHCPWSGGTKGAAHQPLEGRSDCDSPTRTESSAAQASRNFSKNRVDAIAGNTPPAGGVCKTCACRSPRPPFISQCSTKTNPIDHAAEMARDHLVAVHWPQCPFFPDAPMPSERLTKLDPKSPASTSATNGLPFPIRVGTVFERDRPAQMDAGLAPQCLVQESRVRAPATRRHLYTAFATRCRTRLSRGPLDGEGKIVERNPHRGAGTAITFRHSSTASPLEAQDEAEGRCCRSGRAW